MKISKRQLRRLIENTINESSEVTAKLVKEIVYDLNDGSKPASKANATIVRSGIGGRVALNQIDQGYRDRSKELADSINIYNLFGYHARNVARGIAPHIVGAASAEFPKFFEGIDTEKKDWKGVSLPQVYIDATEKALSENGLTSLLALFNESK